MDYITIIALALGLAMDVFAVSLGIGTSPLEKSARMVFRLSFHFGFFQAAMTLLGWLAGNSLLGIIEKFDHWLVFVILCWLGIKMIIGGLNPEAQLSCLDPSRGKALVGICLATSIDALAAGITLAILNTNMIFTLLMIGIASFILAIIGLSAGNYLGKQFGHRMEIIGGLVLITIGVRVVLRHLEIIQ